MTNENKREIYFTRWFKKDYKALSRRHVNLSRLKGAFAALVDCDQNTLATKYRDHALTGQWNGFRELHVDKDLLLVYRISADSIAVATVRLSNHGALFSKATSTRDIKEYLRETQELLDSVSVDI